MERKALDVTEGSKIRVDIICILSRSGLDIGLQFRSRKKKKTKLDKFLKTINILPDFFEPK